MNFSFGIKSRGEEREFAKIFLQFGNKDERHIKIPNWIIPAHIEKEYNKYSQKFYDRICPRNFYISYFEDSFLVYYGIQNRDGFGQSQCKVFDIPWKRMDLCRWSIYNPNGSLVGHIYNDRSFFKRARWNFEKSEEYREKAEKIKIEFNDYDGEENIATCFIEERAWTHGVGICRWLQYIKRDFVRRVIDIHFEKETGPKKSSWKGGIVGCSQDIKNEQSILSGFLEYAKEHNFTNVRIYTGGRRINDKN